MKFTQEGAIGNNGNFHQGQNYKLVIAEPINEFYFWAVSKGNTIA